MHIDQTILEQRLFFKTDKTKSYYFRIEALKKLYELIKSRQNDILHALEADLGKSHFEGYLTEISVTLLEIRHAIKHLRKWMKIKKVRTPITLFKAKTYLYQEPYGIVLIMSPWNYPFQLAISPLIGAIAAGNTAILKLSEESPHTSLLTKTMLNSIFETSYVAVVLGDLSVSQEVLQKRYDYIFFTGSTHVGKIVMREAAKHLTPVTLELGGKSPAIIDRQIDFMLAAKRIVYGKFINAGQTCIAPDYVLIHQDDVNKFIDALKTNINLLYGDDPILSNDYPRIINQKHHQRLVKLLNDGNILVGGNYNMEKIAPTVMIDIQKDSPLIKDEIFGPILPIFTYYEENQIFEFIENIEKPLALYLFTKKKDLKNKIVRKLSFGGATINDTIMHFANHHVPFGGVGHSGMGNYHGIHSFRTFSHEKVVLDRSTVVDLYFRYPPYDTKRLKFIKRIFD